MCTDPRGHGLTGLASYEIEFQRTRIGCPRRSSVVFGRLFSAPEFVLGEVLILCDRDTVTLYHPCIHSGNGRVTMRDGSEPGSLHGGPGVLGIKDDLIRPGAVHILTGTDMELQDEGLYVAAKTEVSMKHREDYDVGEKRGLPPSSGADKKWKKLETEKPTVKKPSVKKSAVKKPSVKKPSVSVSVAAAVKKPCKPAVGDTVHTNTGMKLPEAKYSPGKEAGDSTKRSSPWCRAMSLEGFLFLGTCSCVPRRRGLSKADADKV